MLIQTGETMERDKFKDLSIDARKVFYSVTAELLEDKNKQELEKQRLAIITDAIHEMEAPFCDFALALINLKPMSKDEIENLEIEDRQSYEKTLFENRSRLIRVGDIDEDRAYYIYAELIREDVVEKSAETGDESSSGDDVPNEHFVYIACVGTTNISREEYRLSSDEMHQNVSEMGFDMNGRRVFGIAFDIEVFADGPQSFSSANDAIDYCHKSAQTLHKVQDTIKLLQNIPFIPSDIAPSYQITQDVVLNVPKEILADYGIIVDEETEGIFDRKSNSPDEDVPF